MYTEFFGLNEKPFSITPDPRYLYLSRRHADALAHLIYGISESGGFIQLTGEVGTGKTTLIRTLLQQLPDKAEIALILNPQLSAQEFLRTICDELGTPPPEDDTVRAVIARLNAFLLKAYAEGRRVVLIVDEAQTLGPELLEQVRLLTNLETATQKLLQIILIGQPELRDVLQRAEMRQIAQRITGRYHLEPLGKAETEAYVKHRLRVAGCPSPVFTPRALTQLYHQSSGIPRLINVVADRALLAAYTRDSQRVGAGLVKQAAAEVFGRRGRTPMSRFGLGLALGAAIVLAATGVLHLAVHSAGADATSAAAGRTASAEALTDSASLPRTAMGRLANLLGTRGTPGSAAAVSAPDEDAAAGELPERPHDPAASPRADRRSGAGAGAASAAAGAPSARAGAASDGAGAASPGTGAASEAAVDADALADAAALRELLAGRDPAATESRALADLFAIWGARYEQAGGDPCVQAAAQNLRCLADGRGSISELRTMNRPAVLTLRQPTGAAYTAVLKALDDDAATLLIAGRTVRVRVSDLVRAWYGEHLILWRPPKAGTKVLRRGTRDPEVVWLRQSLAQIRGEALDARPSALYDAGLEAKVRQFQREHMLDVDGIVGARTQIAILTDLGSPGTPTLLGD